MRQNFSRHMRADPERTFLSPSCPQVWACDEGPTYGIQVGVTGATSGPLVHEAVPALGFCSLTLPKRQG